jgi:hypothetical protein
VNQAIPFFFNPTLSLGKLRKNDDVTVKIK